MSDGGAQCDSLALFVLLRAIADAWRRGEAVQGSSYLTIQLKLDCMYTIL